MLLDGDRQRWDDRVKYFYMFMEEASEMDPKFLRGDTVYLISNGHIIEEATVVMNVAGFVTIRFTERSGGTRVRENRFYRTREEAEASRQ